EEIPFSLNSELVRGLDYYTRTVFEYQHVSLGGAQNALGGGGRYDGLAGALGYKPTAGIGFALGMERTAMMLKEAKELAPLAPDVYAVAVEPKDERYVFHLAGTLREQGGSDVDLYGWVHRRRDLGGLIFIDLRDRSGIVQVKFDPVHAQAHAAGGGLRSESVIHVRGPVRLRPPGTENKELSTGAVEV